MNDSVATGWSAVIFGSALVALGLGYHGCSRSLKRSSDSVWLWLTCRFLRTYCILGPTGGIGCILAGIAMIAGGGWAILLIPGAVMLVGGLIAQVLFSVSNAGQRPPVHRG